MFHQLYIGNNNCTLATEVPIEYPIHKVSIGYLDRFLMKVSLGFMSQCTPYNVYVAAIKGTDTLFYPHYHVLTKRVFSCKTRGYFKQHQFNSVSRFCIKPCV
jgi:hypothetical protein